MSTPPRKTDRVSLARLHHPQSPFGRARDASYEFDLENSNFPTPSKQNATRPRHSYRTGTLAGAYRATSRTSMSDEATGLGLSTSPRMGRDSVVLRSPSSQTSNPPEELVDAYRRIEEDGTLADFVSLDGWDAHLDGRPASRSSPRSKMREREYEGRAFSEAGFLEDFAEQSPRPGRRTSDYTRDEQRLRRVTGKDSPVFSKGTVGARSALTAEHLQRREDEELHPEPEDDAGEKGPSLNLPRTWGSRATRRQEWLRNVSGGSESESRELKGEKNTSSKAPALRMRPENDSAPRPSVRPSNRSSERTQIPARSALGERTANLYTRDGQENSEEKTSGPDQNVITDDGAAIPNTPIVVYKNSKFTKPSPTKRDSQELLRKLSRAESPKLGQIQTPDPPKLFERRIYDKTPRVTGAWIDTPMTERVAEKVPELPADLTKNLGPASVDLPKETEDSTRQEKPTAVVTSQPEEIKPELSPPSTIEYLDSEMQPAKRNRPLLARPKLPKSGLETVIEDVNSGKEALDLGDDTLESLQAIMDDKTELKSEEEEEVAYEQEVLERLRLTSSNGHDSVDLDRLNEKLQSLMRNINEVKNGLNSLEGHVTRDIAIAGRPTSPIKERQQGVHPHDSEHCEKCVHSDGRIYAAIPFPRLWKRNAASRRVQLTHLGLFTVVSLTWYVIECVMCEQYSHPIISDTCDGYCLQPDAPWFPFVTVTMLWRWSHLSAVLAPVMTIAVAIFRLVAQLLGLWDGYVDEGPRLSNIVGEVRINGTPVAFPWLLPPGKSGAPPPLASPPPQPAWTPRTEAPNGDEDQGSMDDDEYV
ncbi:hypothetical protein N7462_009636 [Penicillium macrosclerotiorum]|uniref:uncharacterized protein n=1 Tax=Penicillium macrosclerotiorum TaxID=303699 RepID=UPI0025492487|nr:uncharacterized protein N7462_009636 [Penicillium macrosclerotiorum]KAJ5674197.1 hypothetical protein N7462_009636 [Penicillium macrosclerotiorum]